MRLATILLLFLNSLVYGQGSIGGVEKETITVKRNNIDLVGIWTLTEYDYPYKFKDVWEFTSDLVFKELINKSNKSSTFVPVENGVWFLKSNVLNITVVGQYRNKQQILYNKAQVMTFNVEASEELLILEVVSNRKEIKYRLSKR